MLSLSDNNQTDIINTFMVNIDNPYFKQMIDHIYPTEQ